MVTVTGREWGSFLLQSCFREPLNLSHNHDFLINVKEITSQDYLLPLIFIVMVVYAVPVSV